MIRLTFFECVNAQSARLVFLAHLGGFGLQGLKLFDTHPPLAKFFTGLEESVKHAPAGLLPGSRVLPSRGSRTRR